MRPPLQRAGRSGAVDVAVVNHQVERPDRWIRRIAAMHGLTLITNDHILHQTPDDVIENRDAEE